MKKLTIIAAAIIVDVGLTPAQAYYTESAFGRMYATCLSYQQNGPYAVTVQSARQYCTSTALTCARYGFSDYRACFGFAMFKQTPKQRECSIKADARGLHGFERKAFRAGCKS